MSSLRKTLLSWVCVAGCGSCADAQVSGVVSEQHAEASSVMQALGANMRGLECFDMSMTEEVSHVAPEEDRGFESVVRRRYICNFRERVHLIVASHRVHEFSLTTDEESRKRGLYGVFVDGDARENRFLLGSGTPSPIRVRGDDSDSFSRWSLHASAFPDPRLVGMTMYPYGFVGRISFEEGIRRSVSPPLRLRVNETAEKNRVEVVKTGDSNPDESGTRRRYLMDMERYVPLRLDFEILIRDGGVLPKVTERITWDDRDGTMVPREIHGTRRVKPSRDWKEAVSEPYDVVFSWHSVNDFDELPEVKSNILNNTESVLRLLSEGTDEPDASTR